jgi:hypothetical protein
VVPATDAPQVDLFQGTPITDGEEPLAVIGRLADAGEPGTISDAGQPDAISEAVGRPGYVSPYTEAEWEFDRYYFATGGGKAVYVDTVTGGLERAHQEADKRAAANRRWAEQRGVKYMVVVEDTATV